MTTTDSTHRALLNSVLHDPADDEPRLVIADYLDEHGQAERAELILCQVELARLDYEGHCVECAGRHPTHLCPLFCDSPYSRVDGLENRSRELLAAYGCAWAADELLKPICFYDHESLISGIKWEYRRGFIAKVECTTETLMGRVCERCRGSGREPSDIWNAAPNPLGRQCDDCKGDKHIPGIAAALARAVPLEQAVLTNLVVERNPNDTFRVYYDEQYIAPLYVLTPQTQDWMSHGCPGRRGWHNQWSSESSARTALSIAAARYCRQQAGLLSG